LGWEDLFEESDFAKLPIARQIEAIRGLTSFSLGWTYHWYANTPDKIAIFDKNPQKLEAVLQPQVRRPRDNVPTGGGTMLDSNCHPLYPGSAVCASCPEKIKPQRYTGIFDHSGPHQSTRISARCESKSKIGKHDVKRAAEARSTRKSGNSDIPNKDEELFELITADPKKVAAWIRDAQKEPRRAKGQSASVKTESVHRK